MLNALRSATAEWKLEQRRNNRASCRDRRVSVSARSARMQTPLRGKFGGNYSLLILRRRHAILLDGTPIDEDSTANVALSNDVERNVHIDVTGSLEIKQCVRVCGNLAIVRK